MKALKHLVMIQWFFVRYAGVVSQRIRINRPFPFADCPDWAVGIVMLTFGQSRMPESRLLYAAACAEWADRQVARKLKAHVAAAAEAMNKNEPGPAARP